jgi:hypothetical protein
MIIPRIGSQGKKGTLKPDLGIADLLLRTIKAPFTSAKDNKNSTLAADPTTSTGRVAVMATMINPVKSTAI